MSRVTNDALASMIKGLEKTADERHGENVKRLERIETQTTRTNGRVDQHDIDLALLKVGRGTGSLDWKHIGAGLGVLASIVWGAIEVLRWVFHVIDNIGTKVMGR